MSKKKNRATKKQQTSSKRRATGKGRSKHDNRILWIVSIAVVAGGLILLNSLSDNGSVAMASPVEFTDVRAHTTEFIGYNSSIELTPEQEAIKKKALTKIPAPCCSDNTAYTCCCPCNMAKTWWGLANHLIADEGYGAEEVQAAVEGWIAFINPDGFSGDVCYTAGGCSRAFRENGCGGMNEKQIVF
jgi:hypothetical protein